MAISQAFSSFRRSSSGSIFNLKGIVFYEYSNMLISYPDNIHMNIIILCSGDGSTSSNWPACSLCNCHFCHNWLGILLGRNA